MMRKTAASFLIIVVFSGVYFIFFSEFMKVDRCMDSGGCWDKLDKVCRVEGPEAQRLCDRANLK